MTIGLPYQELENAVASDKPSPHTPQTLRPTIRGKTLYQRIPIRWRRLALANNLEKLFRFEEAARVRASFVREMLFEPPPVGDDNALIIYINSSYAVELRRI